MPNATRPTRMHTPNVVAACLSISRLRHVSLTFFQASAPRSQPWAFPPASSYWAAGFHLLALSCAKSWARLPVVPGMALVKSRLTDVQLSAYIGEGKASLNGFERIHDLVISKFLSLHEEPLTLEKSYF